MHALLIKNQKLWPDSKSSSLGRHLRIVDSTDNLLVFAPECSEQEILDLVNPVHQNAYQLLKLKQSADSQCEFLADSGLCYSREEH